MTKTARRSAVLPVEDFVVNESSSQFRENELHLLNHGLNFIPPTNTPPLQQIVVDLEANICFQPKRLQDMVRPRVEHVLIGLQTTPADTLDKTICCLRKNLSTT